MLFTKAKIYTMPIIIIIIIIITINGVRGILARGVNAPLPPEAKKLMKI